MQQILYSIKIFQKQWDEYLYSLLISLCLSLNHLDNALYQKCGWCIEIDTGYLTYLLRSEQASSSCFSL